MSSSTDKEREILERQRRLAAQLNHIPVVDQRKPPPPPPKSQSTTSSRNTSTKQPPPPPPKNPYRNLSSSSSSSASKPSKNIAIIDLTDDSPKKSTRSDATTTAMINPTNSKSTTTTSSHIGGSSSSNTLKRPTLKRPKSSMSTAAATMGSGSTKSAADILAAARAKASMKHLPPTTTTTTTQNHDENCRTAAKQVTARNDNNDETIRKKSPKVQRKAIHSLLSNGANATKKSSSLTLASLVQHVVASSQGENQDGSPMTMSHNMNPTNPNNTIPPYQPDDFWKNLRDWDLPSQYYYETQVQLQQQQQQPQPQNDVVETPSLPPPPALSDKKQLPSLPDTYINARHYIASWAPLCMAECRSQLLQELTTSSSNTTHPILVQVESTHPYHLQSNARRNGKDPYDYNNSHVSSWLEENETAGYLKISCPKQQQGGGGGNMSFFQNDIVLLVQESYRDIIRNIGNNVQKPTNNGQNNDVCDGVSTNAFLGISLIGHTETTRRELDGLIIKVSKRKWTKYGTKQMYFIKVGSNVTALREFTALCSMTTLPMSTFLLGLHLEKAEHRRKLSRNQPMEQLISQMGGVEKLGDGFIQYACKKYNQSQLTAIAASAHEYGEGGFTLIKGPPGTGSMSKVIHPVPAVKFRLLEAKTLLSDTFPCRCLFVST